MLPSQMPLRKGPTHHLLILFLIFPQTQSYQPGKTGKERKKKQFFFVPTMSAGVKSLLKVKSLIQGGASLTFRSYTRPNTLHFLPLSCPHAPCTLSPISILSYFCSISLSDLHLCPAPIYPRPCPWTSPRPTWPQPERNPLGTDLRHLGSVSRTLVAEGPGLQDLGLTDRELDGLRGTVVL